MNFRDFMNSKKGIFDFPRPSIFDGIAGEMEVGADFVENLDTSVNSVRQDINNEMQSALLSGKTDPYNLVRQVFRAGGNSYVGSGIDYTEAANARHRANSNLRDTLFEDKRPSLLNQMFFEERVLSLALNDKFSPDLSILDEFNNSIELGSSAAKLAKEIFGESSGTFKVSSLFNLATAFDRDDTGEIILGSSQVQSDKLNQVIKRNGNQVSIVQAPSDLARADFTYYAPNLINNLIYNKVSTGNFDKTGLINRGNFLLTSNKAILFGMALSNDNYGIQLAGAAQTYGTDLTFEKNDVYTGYLYRQVEKVVRNTTEKQQYTNERNIQTKNLEYSLPGLIADLANDINNTDKLFIQTRDLSFISESLGVPNSPLKRLFDENRVSVLIDSKKYQEHLNKYHDTEQSDALDKLKTLKKYIASGQILESSARAIGQDSMSITNFDESKTFLYTSGSYNLGQHSSNDMQFVLANLKYQKVYGKSRLAYERYQAVNSFRQSSGGGFEAETALSYRQFLQEVAAQGQNPNNPINVLTYNLNRSGAAGSAIDMLERKHGALVLSNADFNKVPGEGNPIVGSMQHAKVVLTEKTAYIGSMGAGGAETNQRNFAYRSSNGAFVGAVSAFFSDLKQGTLRNSYGTREERLLVEGPHTKAGFDFAGNILPNSSLGLADSLLDDLRNARKGTKVNISSATITSEKIINALAGAASKGAEVNVRFDYSGIFGHNADMTPIAVLRRLSSSGVNLFVSDAQATKEYDKLRQQGLGPTAFQEHGNLFTISGPQKNVAYVSSARLSEAALSVRDQLNVAVRVEGAKTLDIIRSHEEDLFTRSRKVRLKGDNIQFKKLDPFDYIDSGTFNNQDDLLLAEQHSFFKNARAGLGLNKSRREIRGYGSDNLASKEQSIALRGLLDGLTQLKGGRSITNSYRFRSGDSAEIASVVSKIGDIELEFTVDALGRVYMPKTRQHLSEILYKNDTTGEASILSPLEVARSLVATTAKLQTRYSNTVLPDRFFNDLAEGPSNFKALELHKLFVALVKTGQSEHDSQSGSTLEKLTTYENLVRHGSIAELLKNRSTRSVVAEALATRASNSLVSSLRYDPLISQGDRETYRKTIKHTFYQSLKNADSDAGYLNALDFLGDLVLPTTNLTERNQIYREANPSFRAAAYKLLGRPNDGSVQNDMQRILRSITSSFLRSEGGAGGAHDARLPVYGNREELADMSGSIDEHAVLASPLDFSYADHLRVAGRRILFIPSISSARPTAVDPLTGMAVASMNENEDLEVGAGRVYDLDKIIGSGSLLSERDGKIHATFAPGKETQFGQRIKNYLGARSSFDLSASGKSRLAAGEQINLDNISDFIHEKTRTRLMMGSLQIKQVQQYIRELSEQNPSFGSMLPTQQTAMISSYVLRQELRLGRNYNNLATGGLRIVAFQTSGLGHGDWATINAAGVRDYITPTSSRNVISGYNISAGNHNLGGPVDSTREPITDPFYEVGPSTFSFASGRLMIGRAVAAGSTLAKTAALNARTYVSNIFRPSSRGVTNDYQEQTENLSVRSMLSGSRLTSVGSLFKGPARIVTDKVFNSIRASGGKQHNASMDLLAEMSGENNIYAIAGNSNFKAYSFDFGIQVIEDKALTNKFLQMSDALAGASLALSLYGDDKDVINAIMKHGGSFNMSDATKAAIKLRNLDAIKKGFNTSQLDEIAKTDLANELSKDRLMAAITGAEIEGSFTGYLGTLFSKARSKFKQTVDLGNGESASFSAADGGDLYTRGAAIAAQSLLMGSQFLSRDSSSNVYGARETDPALAVEGKEGRKYKLALAAKRQFFAANGILDAYDASDNQAKETLDQVYAGFATPTFTLMGLNLSTNPSLTPISSENRLSKEYQFTFEEGILDKSFKGLQRTISTMHAMATGREIEISRGVFNSMSLQDYYSSPHQHDLLEAALSQKTSPYYDKLNALESKSPEVDHLNKMIGNIIHKEKSLKNNTSEAVYRQAHPTVVVMPAMHIYTDMQGIQSLVLSNQAPKHAVLLPGDLLKSLIATSTYSEPAVVAQHKLRKALASSTIRNLAKGRIQPGRALSAIEVEEFINFQSAVEEAGTGLATAVSEKRLEQWAGKTIGEFGRNVVAFGLNGGLTSNEIFVGPGFQRDNPGAAVAEVTRSGPPLTGSRVPGYSGKQIRGMSDVAQSYAEQGSDIELSETHNEYALGMNTTAQDAMFLGDKDGDFYGLAFKKYHDINSRVKRLQNQLKSNPLISKIKEKAIQGELKKLERERTRRKETLQSSEAHKRLTQWASNFTGLPVDLLKYDDVYEILHKSKYTSGQIPGNTEGTEKIAALTREVNAIKNIAIWKKGFDRITNNDVSVHAEYLSSILPEREDPVTIADRLNVLRNSVFNPDGTVNQDAMNSVISGLVSQGAADSLFKKAHGYSFTMDELHAQSATQGYAAKDLLGKLYKNLEHALPMAVMHQTMGSLVASGAGETPFGRLVSEPMDRLTAHLQTNHPGEFAHFMDMSTKSEERYQAISSFMQVSNQLMREGLKEKSSDRMQDLMAPLVNKLKGVHDVELRAHIIREHNKADRLGSLIAFNELFELSDHELQYGEVLGSEARTGLETKFGLSLSDGPVLPQLTSHTVQRVAKTLADYAHSTDGTGHNSDIIQRYLHMPDKRNYVAGFLEEEALGRRETLDESNPHTKEYIETDAAINRLQNAAHGLRAGASIEKIYGLEDPLNTLDQTKDLRNVTELAIRREKFSQVASYLPLDEMVMSARERAEARRRDPIAANEILLNAVHSKESVGSYQHLGFIAALLGESEEYTNNFSELVGAKPFFKALRSYRDPKTGQTGTQILLSQSKAAQIAAQQYNTKSSQALVDGEVYNSFGEDIHPSALIEAMSQGTLDGSSAAVFKTASQVSNQHHKVQQHHGGFLGILAGSSLLARLNSNYSDNHIHLDTLTSGLAEDAFMGVAYSGPHSLGTMARTSMIRENYGHAGDANRLLQSTTKEVVNAGLFTIVQPMAENYLLNRLGSSKALKGGIGIAANFASMLISRPIAKAFSEKAAGAFSDTPSRDDNIFTAALDSIAQTAASFFSSDDELEDDLVGEAGLEELDYVVEKYTEAQEYVAFGFKSINNDGEEEDVEVDEAMEEDSAAGVQLREKTDPSNSLNG